MWTSCEKTRCESDFTDENPFHILEAGELECQENLIHFNFRGQDRVGISESIRSSHQPNERACAISRRSVSVREPGSQK